MTLLQVIRQVAHEANLCAVLRHENSVEFVGGGEGVVVVVVVVILLLLLLMTMTMTMMMMMLTMTSHIITRLQE